MSRERIIRLLPYLFLSLFCIGVFIKPFGSGDELWNYNFARGIAHGMKPYVDISMIQTPLSAYLAAIFVRLFGNGLFSFRIAGFVLMVAMNVILYKLCLRTRTSASIAFVFTAFVDALHLMMWIYNYNYLIICLVLWAMYLYLGGRYNSYLIAVLFGLLPLIKQSTGAVLLIAFYLICSLEIVCEKKKITKAFVEFMMSLIPCTIYIVYLVISGSFHDFWNYAILGVTTFTHRTTYISFALSNPVWFMFALFPWLVLGYAAYQLIFKKRSIKKIKCFILAIACLSFAYPLCDTYHFCTAIIPLSPLLLLFTKNTTTSKVAKGMCVSLGVTILTLSLESELNNINGYVFSNLNGYERIPISQEMEDGIRTVDEYISRCKSYGKECIIADESAAAYMIPLSEYHKNWDMLLVGNLGLETVESMMENNEDSIFLIMRERSFLGQQAHYELIDYIANNYRKIDEVLCFDVYSKK